MLMRLRDPKDPLLGVGRHEFVPVARELKLQAGIDRMLLTHALRALDDQRTRNRVTDLLVPMDFRSIDREQLAWIQGELGRNKHVDQRLTLEFESALLTESGHAARLLERLRADGVLHLVILADDT